MVQKTPLASGHHVPTLGSPKDLPLKIKEEEKLPDQRQADSEGGEARPRWAGAIPMSVIPRLSGRLVEDSE